MNENNFTADLCVGIPYLDGLMTPKPKTRGIKVVGCASLIRTVLAYLDGDLRIGGCFWLITKTKASMVKRMGGNIRSF
jgi:hypothetical protein